jgi:hypothetical protein
MKPIVLTILLPLAAHAAPPPHTDPTTPESQWYRGAMTPECYGCCDIADGRPVLARPDPASPLGWDVLLDGVWTPVPAGTRATRCADPVPPQGGEIRSDYPPHPAGYAVVWIYRGRIRCFSPPGTGS